MNERFTELAKQAGFGSAWFEESKPGHPAMPKEGMLKEFAELIVRECMKLNHEHFNDEDPYSIDSLYRQHFGFKE